VLVVAERRKRLSEAATVRFLALLRALPITVDPASPERAFTEIVTLARTHGLSSYDASYLELAIRRGVPIATLDTKLSKAAGECGVPIFVPET